MEPAKINWQSIESVFVRDDTYENINAPQWVDFLASDDEHSLEDAAVAWFCKPDCKHPKTAEDFLKSTPTSKLLKSVSVSKLIGLGDWSRNREGNLKRRGPPQDGENQNPNLATPPAHQIKPAKAAIKSSAEKEREPNDDFSEISLHSDENRKLKSTLSARDLFAGRDLLGKITDFCNELKKMATTRAKEKDSDDCNHMDKLVAKKSLLEAVTKEEEVLSDRLEKTNDKERERKPLLEVSKERYEGGIRSPFKEKQMKKTRADDAENIPLSLDLKNAKGKGEESFQSVIRTSPPTPQCFSATRDPVNSTLLKAPKSRLKEREAFQEIELKEALIKEEVEEKSNGRNHTRVIAAGREGRPLDVFWFFKPCANSSAEF